MIASWVNEYIGLPYLFAGRTREGCDCWGLVRIILLEQFGKDLPPFGCENADQHALAGVVESAIPVLPIDEVNEPLPGDIVLLKLLGLPSHVGIVAGDGYMVHTLHAHEAALDRYTGPRWAHRIEGFYRVR